MSWKHEEDKVITFDRAGLLFVFNFHPTKSFTDYRVAIDVKGTYEIILSSDDKVFGGFDRLHKNVLYVTEDYNFGGRRYSFQVA